MSKHLVSSSLGFQAIATGAYLIQPNMGALVLFALASIAQLFLVWLDRNTARDTAQVQAKLSQLESAITNIAMQMRNL